MQKQAQSHYPGNLGIKRRHGLPPEQSQVERGFSEALEADPKGFVKQYRDRFGNIVSTDSARALWQEYDKDPRSRSELAYAVQYPAMALSREVWRNTLSEQPQPGKDTVLFLAGGGGAGKSYALANVPEVAAIAKNAHAVFDSTMGNYSNSVERLQQALDAGFKATIVYVYRPLSSAVRGVVKRAVEEGRTVPISAVVRDHLAAIQNVKAILSEFPNVSAIAVDNSGERPRVTSLQELEQSVSAEGGDLETVAIQTVNDEYRRRKGTPEELDDRTYRALVGSTPKTAAWLAGNCRFSA